MASLREVLPFEYNFSEATQEQQASGILGTFKGTFQRADSKNANNRIYPRSLFEKVLSSDDVQSRLNGRAMLGELDHPQSGTTSVSRVSHVVTKNQLMPDGTVYGEAEILDTPMGRILETLGRARVRIGVSSRADGTTTTKGDAEYVNESDFRLETYDVVIKPSTPGAYPTFNEEERSKEEHRILVSLKSLVNSSSDPRVLLESSKILSSLDAVPSQEHLALETSIQERLVALYESKPTTMERNPMTDNQNVPAPDFKQMESMVRDLASKKIEELASLHEGQVSDLNKRIVEATGEKDQLQKKLSAAEKIIEELLRQRETIRTTSLKEGADKSQARLKAASDLLEETVKRLRKSKNVSRKYEAARGLLTAMVEKQERAKIIGHRNSLLSQIPEANRTAVKGLLREAKTIEQLDRIFESAKKLAVAPHRDSRQPLPNQVQVFKKSDSSLNESPRVRPEARSTVSLVEKFNRISGVK